MTVCEPATRRPFSIERVPTAVEAAYDAAVICLPAAMKLYRAAAHVADLRVRRIVACKAREPIGIVSATDFARLVAMS